MIRKYFGAGLVAALFATTAMAGVEKVASVEVTADISAIQNEKAAAYWGNLAEDLKAAIITRIGDRIGEKGAVITIDIREVELANAFERALNSADAVLVGQVIVNDETDHGNDAAYELSVTLGGTPLVPSADGTITLSTTDTPQAYSILINLFADQVIERMK
ncbi:MAG: hypothetical protein Q7J57_18095 [Gemmobacter sp.]|nr:hypothetical protein [Gemmobacter sp.]